MSPLLLGRMGISRWINKLWIMDGKMFEGWMIMMDGWVSEGGKINYGRMDV